jgi:type VI secretion system protein VasG
MYSLSLKNLIDKLNPICRKALEGAAGLCQTNTHYEVEIEHLLLKLIEDDTSDIARILAYFEIDPSRMQTQLTATIAQFKTGNGRTPALSTRISKLISKAWLLATVQYQDAAVCSGHILLTLLSKPYFSATVLSSARALEGISVATLAENLADITLNSSEKGYRKAAHARQAAGSDKVTPMAGTGALGQYTINLTERARAGQIDPVIARDEEIRQMADILIRRRQNNPILTGEAGVGKTVVVEGFALRVVQGDVPGPLKDVEVRTLDLGLLQAGAGIKGEFENRLKSVINEVKASPVPIILFIDEAHTMIGAGGAQGAGDAANLLKPALAKGELRTIAATTWAEYKKYFEKDAALSRRFQVVKIEEPDEDKAMLMMRAIAPLFEEHHGVTITDDALVDSVRLSMRYISGRKLPDKSVGVIDTACARVAMGFNAIAPPVEACQRRIEKIDRELERLLDEQRFGRDHAERIQALLDEQKQTRQRLEELQQRWKQEIDLVERIKALRDDIREQDKEENEDGKAIEAIQEQLKALETELESVQRNEPLLKVEVDSQTICDVISGWTGIPTGRMLTDEIPAVLNLEKSLGKRIIGQDQALGAISRVVRTAHAGIEDPSKPTGVFLLVGPSGVGKTETALALSELLYGGEQNMVTINMSEYQEAHTVSGLKGSPPGYVGYGEGGVLTEAVRRRPYSVVLLDEIEKAHPDVTELFYQVFDKGMLEDGEGRRIDFKNTLIILTSNIGTDLIMAHCYKDPATAPDMENLKTMLTPELQQRFKPAFLGRLQVVPYYPITDDVMQLIIRLKLDRIADRMRANRKIEFIYADEVVEAIAGRCTEVDSGARNVDHILTDTLLPELSRRILEKMAAEIHIDTIRVTTGEKGFDFEFNRTEEALAEEGDFSGLN